MLSASAQRVQDALTAAGFAYRVTELPQTTRTSAEAAQAVGCEVGQIAKSLVFRGKRTGRAILAIASGSNRVDERRLGELVGEPIERATADFVREQTGFVIGGVPPLGHQRELDTYVDEELLQYSEVWAAAGTPFAVFRLSPKDIPAMTGGKVVHLRVS